MKIKKYNNYFARIRSRHPSHKILRKSILLPFRSIVRLGSTTPSEIPMIECNTIDAVKNSSDKLLMKRCFTANDVKTAEWLDGHMNITAREISLVDNTGKEIRFPIVAKSRFGSRGRGNTLIKDLAAWTEWSRGKDFSNYIFEKFYNYAREYRLHVSTDGCFYSCRKMLKEGTPEENKWYRNDSNCVWYLEDNPNFNKPNTWNEIEKHCVTALLSVGLDIGACDVKVSADSIAFIVIEINSAPSFGDITAVKYKEEIKNVLLKKR